MNNLELILEKIPCFIIGLPAVGILASVIGIFVCNKFKYTKGFIQCIEFVVIFFTIGMLLFIIQQFIKLNINDLYMRTLFFLFATIIVFYIFLTIICKKLEKIK